MPWKNGGGTTREIAIEPDPEGATRPLWRLSIATIASDGPFSDFMGYDRTIVAIEGGGVELTFANGQAVTLDRERRALGFPGEQRVWCRLLEGPVRDLNVMTRRDRFTHSLELAVSSPNGRIRADGARYVVVLEGELKVGGEIASPLDAVALDPNGETELPVGDRGVCACVVRLTTLDSAHERRPPDIKKK
jgi:environmental stress-induced protein Ves